LLLPGAHFAPDRRVVARLALHALLLGFTLLRDRGADRRHDQSQGDGEGTPPNRKRFHEPCSPYSARVYSFCPRLRVLTADSQLALSPLLRLQLGYWFAV